MVTFFNAKRNELSNELSISEFPKSRSDYRSIENIIPQDADRFLPEFRLSAIPDRLTLANVRWIEGEEAIEVMTEEAISQVQKVTSYVTEGAKWILKNTEFARSGGWIAYGTTLDGSCGQVPYFKPLTPKITEESRGFGQAPKLKVTKYPNPQGCPATPLLPIVESQTAQEIYDRYHATPEPGETFWQVVKRCNIPIAITEGFKKALALIAHGIPAIAIRGITQWRIPKTDELHPTIADFATKGRKMYVVFDQDEKESTKKTVKLQILELGKAIEAAKSRCLIVEWDGAALGKGADDVLYGLGDGAALWLDDVLSTAKTLKQINREEWKIEAAQRIQALTKVSYPAIRSTRGEYIPNLPSFEIGKVQVLRATIGSGKTRRIGADWLDQAKKDDYFTIVLQPTNSVGHQAATDWNLPHRHDFGDSADAMQILWSDARHRGGIVLCPESLHRLADWIYNEKILLIVDEATQVTKSLSNGSTFSNQSLALALAQTLAKSATTVVLAEDGIDDRAIDFWLSLRGGNKDDVILYNHVKEATPWPVSVYSGQKSGFHDLLGEQINAGRRIFYASTAQDECEYLEQALKVVFPDKKIVRIDSQTNEVGKFANFFERPDPWCLEHKPDILIVSPSVKSGLSIDGDLSAIDSYFDAVFGYFPSLDVESHIQMLGRVRPPVPRFVFCPHYILNSQFFSPREFQREMRAVGRAAENFFKAEVSSETLPASVLSAAVGRFLAVDRTLECLRKSIALDQLVSGLSARGHDVAEPESLRKQDFWKKALRNAEEFCDRRTADLMAEAVLTTHLDKNFSPYVNRLYEQREAAVLKFPDIDFSASSNCYELLVRERGSMGRGILRQVRAENLDFNRALDSDNAKHLLEADVQLNHRLPLEAIEAWILGTSGVLELLDGKSYDGNDDRIKRIRSFAIRQKREIKRFLRLTITDEQTGVEIAHKLLKKFDLALRHKHDRPGCIQMMGRFGARGDNSEVFLVKIDPMSLRHEALESARRAALEFVTSTCNNRSFRSIQVDVTSQNHPKTTAAAAVSDSSEGADLPDESEDFGTYEYIPSAQELIEWRKAA